MRNSFLQLLFTILLLATSAVAQEQVPEPGPARPFRVPALVETTLPNGLRVAVVERKSVPLVTVRLMIDSGAGDESPTRAGLADLTAALATKRTATRNADQIAEQMEFLGAGLISGADWTKSVFTFTVASDKLEAAMAILGDVMLNSTSDANELKLLKAQALDNLAADLKEPSFLATYVMSKFAFDEHPPGGTPESIRAISRDDIIAFKREHYRPDNAVLIFTGDVSVVRAGALATRVLGKWRRPASPFVRTERVTSIDDPDDREAPAGKILVIDLPDSGQSAVSYTRRLKQFGRVVCGISGKCESDPNFAAASVMNSVLGGGYSSRLNQEIRIKRGLSYGAGSGFAWRRGVANFAARTQTKDDSAAEVAEIIFTEINRLGSEMAPETEIAPRKLVITGDFSREFETTDELAETLTAIYNHKLGADELNGFADRINRVAPAEIKRFAIEHMRGGHLVIAGDYRKFREDLAKRFPRMEIIVISSERLDLASETLQR